jgi:hypothetical protein
MKDKRVNGCVFRYNEHEELYECKGDVIYNEDNDACVDPYLMEAARELVAILKEEGIDSYTSSSEKGWVSVYKYRD